MSKEGEPTQVDSTHKYNIIKKSGETSGLMREEEGSEQQQQESVAMVSAREIPGMQPEGPPPPQPEPELDPLGTMLKREYDHAVEQEIKKGVQKISDRFSRLVSQENTPTEVAKDALGNTSDYYERLIHAIQSDNSRSIADTTDGLYQLLYDLDFTEMRKLSAIKQEYNQL